MAYGGSEARGQIGTTATETSDSEPLLQPTPQLMATAGSSTQRVRPGIEPTSSWIVVVFVSTPLQWELQFCE